MVGNIPLWLLIALAVLSLGFILCVLQLIVFSKRLQTFMQGKKAASLESLLSWLSEKHAAHADTLQAHKQALEQIDGRVKKSIRTPSLVQYDAFSDAGGNQSFASAFLDEEGDGYILSVIAHRNQTHTYTKHIKNFEPAVSLTEEETEALLKVTQK